MSNLAKSLNTFSLKLTNQLTASTNENFFVSPFSILTALAMCYFGAKHETARQLKNLLDLNAFDDNERLLQEIHTFMTMLNEGKNVTLNTANKIYPRLGYPLNDDFVDKIRNGFRGDVEELDYSKKEQAARTINSWVEDQTAKKITNLISPNLITPYTRLILVNAIYFKGSWAMQFEKAKTEKKNFNLLGGSLKQVDMMQLNGKSFKVHINPLGLECQTLELPYAGDKVAITIILPNKNVDLTTFQKSLQANHIHDLLKLKNIPRKVNVQLPKFKLEKQFELVDHFKKMGVIAPFDNSADFSGISGKPDLLISNVIHKAVIELNEEGTVAAAATAVIVNRMKSFNSNVQLPLEFIADRPFLFVIHEKVSNTVLFLGKFVDPSQ